MINLAIGIAIGAAFSSFWIKLYNLGKDWAKSKLGKE